MIYSPSRREGARGWAIQFRASLCSSTDILYAMGIKSTPPDEAYDIGGLEGSLAPVGSPIAIVLLIGVICVIGASSIR
jgi:hypothetical protein